MFVAKAPSVEELFEKLGLDAALKAFRASGEGPAIAGVPAGAEYLHWDKLRQLEPPAGLTREEWWLAIKAGRSASQHPLALADRQGNPFSYSVLDSMHRQLRQIDQRCAGEVAMDEVVTSERAAGRRFLVNSLMEEAIRSSQLEGATTSRVVAKEMLRSGREPTDRSERMILNNYRALQFMRD